jgi:DNA-binding Lrp family transcriptional regulator
MVMEKTLSELDRKILVALQDGLPEGPEPYAELALRAGVARDVLLKTLSDWASDGRLRRIGAVVNHFEAGWGHGAMVVWNVPAERVEDAGSKLAGFREVTHAYERRRSPGWPYNLYTMVHGRTENEVAETVKRMSCACGIDEYLLLKTVKELKKVPPRYVKDRGD